MNSIERLEHLEPRPSGTVIEKREEDGVAAFENSFAGLYASVIEKKNHVETARRKAKGMVPV
jgi:hypothetical protein